VWNAVGVEVNTAVRAAAARVPHRRGLAENIVLHRDANGPFKNRSEIKKVARLGPKAFEQCAGFLRIPDGDDPLDASACTPESYPVVRHDPGRRGSRPEGRDRQQPAAARPAPEQFVTDTVGLPTSPTSSRELEKPGP
jgi:uncharacterized protein